MPTFCRNEGECSKRLRGESEWRFFVSEKCLLKTRLLRARVLVALFLPFFFSFLDVCVLSWPADIVFSGCLALDERVQHTDQKTSNILSKVSPHNLASHHHRYQTHEKSFHAFQREREFRCAEQQQQQQRLLFHRLCFFFKSFYRARARACLIYARRAHFNHPSHGAALSHVETTMIAARRTRARRLFRAKEEETKTEESPKKTQ